MFKRSFIYIFINYLMQGMNIILNLLFMKFLSGVQLGDLALARTWQQSLDYTHGGTRFSLDRFIPIADDEKKIRLLSSVVIVTFLAGCCLFIVSSMISGFNTTIVVFTFIGFIISIINVIKAYLRACGNIDRMLIMVMVTQLLPISASVVFYFFTKNFEIYLYSWLLSFIATTLLISVYERKLIVNILHSAKYFVETIREIVKPSILLFVNSLLVFLYMVMDRFFVDHFLGREALGNYSVITFAFTALMIVPASCAELIFSKIIRQSVEEKKKIYIRESALCVGITLCGVIVANMLMGYFINNYTDYANLLDLMHLATFAVVPFALTSVYYHVLNGHDLRRYLLAVSACVCLAQISYYFILFFTSNLSIAHFLYAKLATGWVIFIGYMVVILTKKTSVSE